MISTTTTTGTVTTTFAGSVEQRFFKLLAEHIKAHEQTLCAGQLADFATYKWHAGVLKGLQDVEALWHEAAQDVQKSEGSLRRAV